MKLEIELKNAKRVLQLLERAKTSNIHDRNLNAIILRNCISNIEKGLPDVVDRPSRIEQLKSATKRGERFLLKILYRRIF